MRASINPPSSANDEASHQLECQFALEPSLSGLTRKAVEAGWDEMDILLAMLNFASQRITKLDSALLDASNRDPH